MIGGRRLDVRFQMTAKGRSFFGRKRPDEVQIEWFRQSLEAHEWENVTYSDRVLEPTLPPDLNEATRFISLARFDRTSETGKAIAARVAMALAAYRHGRFQISLADAQVSTKYYPTDFAQGATITVVLLLLMALPLALVVRAHVRRCRRLAAEADALLDRLGIPATSQTQPDAAALPGGR